ncbi:uncharacterized protein SOCE26_103790 [Sorangium cellulosum]|uniref:Uncharacterized protein n=1 Tax=Sorangium cellulosum TaxID=56 RepID=A0A2L0FBF8_SORCE|nr:uncharacterized protein SOCE26_103790 [Sorangium cellulosum]
MGHTRADLGGETGGSYEKRCCFRRPRTIERFFWRDCPAGANRRDPAHPRGFGESVTTDRTRSEGVDPTRLGSSP